MLANLLTTTSLSFLPYLFLGLFALVEGPTAALLGGAAASGGLLHLLPVYISVVMGNLIADVGWYSVGRFNNIDTLSKFLQRVKISSQRIAQLEQDIHKNAPKLLFFAKLTVGFPIPILIATGMSRVRGYRWIIYLILGELIKSAGLVGVGFLYSNTIKKTSSGVQEILWAITAIFAISGFIWFKRRKNKSGI